MSNYEYGKHSGTRPNACFPHDLRFRNYRTKHRNRIIPLLLAHRIRLDPNTEQRDYFARAAGTARRVWNWALAEWLRQRDAGGKPNAYGLKRQFNGDRQRHTQHIISIRTDPL